MASLTKIVKDGKGKKVIEINGRRFYGVGEAAKIAEVTRQIMFRWCSNPTLPSKIPEIDDLHLEVYRDKVSRAHYISPYSLWKLRPENRIINPYNEDIKDAIRLRSYYRI